MDPQQSLELLLEQLCRERPQQPLAKQQATLLVQEQAEQQAHFQLNQQFFQELQSKQLRQERLQLQQEEQQEEQQAILLLDPHVFQELLSEQHRLERLQQQQAEHLAIFLEL